MSEDLPAVVPFERPPPPARVEITVYDLASGEALYSTMVNEGRENDCCAEGQGWVPGRISGATHRIDPATGEVLELLEFEPKIEVDRISNLPPGTVAHIGISKFTVDESGEIEFELPHVQTVPVRLWHPLYRDVEPFEVSCEAHG